MTRYRARITEIDAIQWTGDNIPQVMAFMRPQVPVHVNSLSHLDFANADDLVGIPTSVGLQVANRGDWIVRDATGELAPCRDTDFQQTYEPVPDDLDDHSGLPVQVVLAVATLRTAAEWLPADHRRLLMGAAEDAERNWADGGTCPVCEEMTCDEGCPLVHLRAALDAPPSGQQQSPADTEPTAVGEPQSITDEQLLPWLVIAWQRNLQAARGAGILLPPFPRCPACGAHVTDADTRQTPASLNTVFLGMLPCGHTFRCQDATIDRLSEQARHLAEKQLNQALDSPETAGS